MILPGFVMQANSFAVKPEDILEKVKTKPEDFTIEESLEDYVQVDKVKTADAFVLDPKAEKVLEGFARMRRYRPGRISTWNSQVLGITEGFWRALGEPKYANLSYCPATDIVKIEWSAKRTPGAVKLSQARSQGQITERRQVDIRGFTTKFRLKKTVKELDLRVIGNALYFGLSTALPDNASEGDFVVYEARQTSPRHRGHYNPDHLSVHYNGNISIPGDYIEDLGDPTHLLLLYNPKTMEVGLSAGDPEDPRAYKISYDMRYASLNSRAIISCKKIWSASRLKPHFINVKPRVESNMIVFKLS